MGTRKISIFDNSGKAERTELLIDENFGGLQEFSVEEQDGEQEKVYSSNIEYMTITQPASVKGKITVTDSAVDEIKMTLAKLRGHKVDKATKKVSLKRDRDNIEVSIVAIVTNFGKDVTGNGKNYYELHHIKRATLSDTAGSTFETNTDKKELNSVEVEYTALSTQDEEGDFISHSVTSFATEEEANTEFTKLTAKPVGKGITEPKG